MLGTCLLKCILRYANVFYFILIYVINNVLDILAII